MWKVLVQMEDPERVGNFLEDFVCTAKESPRQLRGATLGGIKNAVPMADEAEVDNAGKGDPAHPSEIERGEWKRC